MKTISGGQIWPCGFRIQKTQCGSFVHIPRRVLFLGPWTAHHGGVGQTCPQDVSTTNETALTPRARAFRILAGASSHEDKSMPRWRAMMFFGTSADLCACAGVVRRTKRGSARPYGRTEDPVFGNAPALPTSMVTRSGA